MGKMGLQKVQPYCKRQVGSYSETQERNERANGQWYGASGGGVGREVRSRPLTSPFPLTFHLCKIPTFVISHLFNTQVSIFFGLIISSRKFSNLHQPLSQNSSIPSPSTSRLIYIPQPKVRFFSLYVSLFLCLYDTKRTQTFRCELWWLILR